MKFLATVAELEAAKSETAKAVEALGLMEVRATTAEAAVKELESQLSTAKSEAAAAVSEIAAAKEALAAEAAKVVDLTAKLAEKSAEVSQVKGSVEKQVAAQASATVASLGHQPVISAAVSAGSKSREELKAEYLAITDPVDRAKFWAANKTALQLALHNQRN